MRQQPHPIMSRYNIIGPHKTVYDVPTGIVTHMSVKLALLGALAWDYADTVIDIAGQLRIQHTKKPSRAIRELKQRYDQLRCGSLDDNDIRREMALAVLFEDINRQTFRRLCQGLNTEISRQGLTGSWLSLVQSVQMAMTVIDAMRIYADECDRWLENHGVGGNTILPVHFRSLATLLPVFAGDCYNPDSQSRKLTARILVNEIKQIELYDNNGKV